MDGAILAAVLFAAFLHAAWNAMLKLRGAGADHMLAAAAVTPGAGVTGALLLPFLPAPAPASWPFIAASAVLHALYYAMLAATYRSADISHAYPLMRGSAPVMVALAGGLLGAERLHGAQWLAIGLVFAGGVAVYAGSRTGSAGNDRLTLLAVSTAAMIAACTLVDGFGVRRSGAPAAYTAWIFLLTGAATSALAWGRMGAALPRYLLRHPWLALAGGAATTCSYGIALWAMSFAPVAVVAALRETSIVFALAIAMLVLGERPLPARLAGAGLIALGAVAVRLA